MWPVRCGQKFCPHLPAHPTGTISPTQPPHLTKPLLGKSQPGFFWGKCVKIKKGVQENPLKHLYFWSGRRDLNPRHQPWQGCALPLSYTRFFCVCEHYIQFFFKLQVLFFNNSILFQPSPDNQVLHQPDDPDSSVHQIHFEGALLYSHPHDNIRTYQFLWHPVS